MDNAGTFTLAAEQLSTAVTAKELTPIIDLDGMTAVTLIAEFAYGTGTTGATAIAKVETSLDGGTSWYEVARFDFALISAVKKCNLSGLLSVGVGAYSTLSANSVNDGFLGDRLRVVLTTTDSYTTTTLSVRASVR